MAQFSTSMAASSRPAELPGLLICTEDPELYLLLGHIVEVAGYRPFLAGDNLDADSKLSQADILAVIVDIATWRGDLELLCQRAGVGGQRVCALISPGDNATHLHLIKAGIEDGIARPLLPGRLLDFLSLAARRRLSPRSAADDAMTQSAIQAVGDAILVGGRLLDVTAIEAKILLALARSSAAPCSREAILEAAWPRHGGISRRTVDAHIARLRKRLAGSPELRIETVYGKGYALVLK